MYLIINTAFFILNLYVYVTYGSILSLVFTALSAVAIINSL